MRSMGLTLRPAAPRWAPPATPRPRPPSRPADWNSRRPARSVHVENLGLPEPHRPHAAGRVHRLQPRTVDGTVDCRPRHRLQARQPLCSGHIRNANPRWSPRRTVQSLLSQGRPDRPVRCPDRRGTTPGLHFIRRPRRRTGHQSRAVPGQSQSTSRILDREPLR